MNKPVTKIGAATSDRFVEVAVVALWKCLNHGPEVLITRRPAGSHLAGHWELPGGKVEPGESPEAAANREVAEEVGLVPGDLQPLMTVEHEYPDRSIRLHAYLAKVEAGHESMSISPDHSRWIRVSDLAAIDFPEANEPVTKAIPEVLGRLRAVDP